MKILTGKVVSTKMTNTVVVAIERVFTHRRYGKEIRRHKRIKAHVEGMIPQEGDTVSIMETRPLSAQKHFKVVKIVKKEKK